MSFHQKQGRIDEALAYATEIHKQFPDDEDIQDLKEVLEDWESVKSRRRGARLRGANLSPIRSS